MNFKEIKNAVEHLQKTCKCMQCNIGYNPEDIHVIATTKIEGLLETKCNKCKTSTIVTILIAPKIEIKEQNTRKHQGISPDDILDIKNFLSTFDGDFKKIFIEQTNHNT